MSGINQCQSCCVVLFGDIGDVVYCIIYENWFLLCCEFVMFGENGEENDVCNWVWVCYGLLLLWFFYKDIFVLIGVESVMME